MNDQQRISELEIKVARLETLLKIVMDIAEKNPLSAKFVKRIKCELPL